MKICIPTMGDKGMDERVGEHFGRVPTYTVVDGATGKVDVVKNTSEHMGGKGLPPELIASTGASVLLCGGLGQRAILMLQERGVKVFVGASGTVSEAIKAYKAGALQMATDENACKEHGHHGEEHHHHGGC